MEILEFLYENPPKSRFFYPRKKNISQKKTILCGSKFSGKSSIIIDHLSNYKKEEYLYIDFSDFRINQNEIRANLKEFLNKKNIKLLVLEHIPKEFDLPNTKEIIVSSNSNLHVEDFTCKFVFPLDFEEFILFEKKHTNIEQVFSLFANIGTLPSIVLRNEEEKYRNMQIIINSMVESKTILEILKVLSNFQSSKVSILHVYELLKQSIKISKDVLYASIKTLQDEFLIFFIEKFEQPKVAKKLYFIDFALNNALTFKKDFLRRFENMIFCELLKKEYKIFYTDMLDFYLPQEKIAILCIPFLPPELIKRRFLKVLKELKSLHVKELFVITVGNEGIFEEHNVTCEILPFWQWALR